MIPDSKNIPEYPKTPCKNVEIMICDVHSYKYAMNYMHAFNPLENIILYWDEPTITLDYDSKRKSFMAFDLLTSCI